MNSDAVFLRVFVFLSIYIFACMPNPDTDTESSITILYDADERVFGPYWSSDPWFLVFLPLVTNDEHGQAAPRLAQSWEHSPDYRNWKFYLRSDVRWHDGVPTTAHDVKFTIELQGRPDILYDDAWHDVDSIVVHDDTTLSIHYALPKDALNDWMVYWPKHILEQLDPADFWEWEFWVKPVGNGPYSYVRHVPKTMVELAANADFFAGKPSIESVRLKFGGSETTVTELLSGNVDIITRVNRTDLAQLAVDSRFRIFHHLIPGVAWINTLVWNHRHFALSDVRVRRALTLGLNRRELLEFLDLPSELRLSDALYTAGQYLAGEIPPPIAFDPDRARALLIEAGWSDTNGDRFLEKNGQALRFTVLAGSDEDEAVAVYAQAAFRDIGVEMEVLRLDEMVVQTRVVEGDFEAAVFALWNSLDGHIWWFGDRGVFPVDLRQFPDIGYRDADVVRLLGAAMDTADPDQRDRIYRQLAPVISTDLPVTFLFPRVRAYVADRRVQGLESPFQADPMRFMENLWIER